MSNEQSAIKGLEKQVEELIELDELGKQLEMFSEDEDIQQLMTDLGNELLIRSTIEVEVLNEGTPTAGRLPVKAHLSDAGFDLYATEDVVFNQGEVTKHPLNIKLKLPPGTYAHIKGKSGLGSKGLCLLAEIIDEGYRGVPHIVATNMTFKPLRIKKGEKIAQILIHPFSNTYSMKKVSNIESDTDRGSEGFGSSGV